MTNAELWAFNVLDNTINNAQQELQRAIASKIAYVKLIEAKYDARFDAEAGEFLPKDIAPPVKKVKEV